MKRLPLRTLLQPDISEAHTMQVLRSLERDRHLMDPDVAMIFDQARAPLRRRLERKRHSPPTE